MNLVDALSFLSPIIISFGILFFSILINAPGKGVFYIFWLLVATAMRICVLSYIPGTSTTQTNINPKCKPLNLVPYDDASFSSFILSFTFFYFTLPMYLTSNVNYIVIIFFIVYIVFDIFVKFNNLCINSSINLFGDIVSGGGLGAAISAMIYSSPMSNYLFTNETSTTKETCSMPSKQTFRCSVYKNGELITTTTT